MEDHCKPRDGQAGTIMHQQLCAPPRVRLGLSTLHSMKSFAFPAIALCACIQAEADVVLEQKIESPKHSGVTRMKIKGDRARIDMQSATGDVTVFLDQTGKMVTYMHESKLALVTTMTETQKTAKALIKKSGVEPRKHDPVKPIGETQSVGGWNCEVWSHITPAATQKLWRTKDIPNLPRIIQQMKTLASVPGMSIDQSEIPDMFTVKTERSDAKGTNTVTVVKISEEAVPESDFAPPEGYREMTIPSK
jgi:hypothetical protein